MQSLSAGETAAVAHWANHLVTAPLNPNVAGMAEVTEEPRGVQAPMEAAAADRI